MWDMRTVVCVMVADGAVVLSRLYSRWQRWSRRRLLRVAISLRAALHVSQPNWLRVSACVDIADSFSRFLLDAASVNRRIWNPLLTWLTDWSQWRVPHWGRPGRGGDRPSISWLGPHFFAVLLTYCGQLILRKISKYDVTRCQILGLIWSRWNISADCATGFL